MTGSSKTTTTASNAPWAAAQPALNTALTDAQKLYKDGTGSAVYTGSTVVPWDQQTQQGMNQTTAAANANSNGAGTSGQFQSIIDNGGYTGDQKNASSALSGILSGDGLTDAQRQAMSGFQSTIGSGGYNAAQQNALTNTQGVANGAFDINSDPGFQQVVDQARNSVNGTASAAGRYGGGIREQTMVNTIGDLGARQYQNFQARKDAANSNLFSMGQTGQSNVAGAQGSLANLGQTGTANRMNAASSLYDMGQGAIGNLGTAYNGLQAPAQDLMKVGSMNEDLATRNMNDKLRIFNDTQQKPWENLSRLNAIASGAGQLGGTSTQSQPGQNPFLSALGYGASGAGLLGSFF